MLGVGRRKRRSKRSEVTNSEEYTVVRASRQSRRQSNSFSFIFGLDYDFLDVLFKKLNSSQFSLKGWHDLPPLAHVGTAGVRSGRRVFKFSGPSKQCGIASQNERKCGYG